MDRGDYITERYIVKEKLGEGGYGAVYLVHDLRTKTDSALKVAKGETQKEQSRFEQEASILNKLNHKGIVPIYNVFKFEDFLCYTMKYIQGNSLEYYTRKSVKITPKKISQLIRDTAIALSYAHENNIIHRDIKPANILYDELDKIAYITDFGLAKEATGKSLTGTGQIVGTPYYLSPEQARGETLTQASDIYSLGATMYHLLTKNPPFEEESRALLIKKIANEKNTPKRIREHNSELHSSLEAICSKAMQKNIKDRYETMLDFAQDIDLFLDNKLPQAPLHKTTGANILINSLKRVSYPLMVGIGIVLPLIGSFFLYTNTLDKQRNNSEKIDQYAKLKEKQQILSQIKDIDNLELSDFEALSSSYKKHYYIQSIAKKKKQLSTIANIVSRKKICADINKDLRALYNIDNNIYGHQFLFELYPEDKKMSTEILFPDVDKQQELFEKRINIINLLRENQNNVVSIDYNYFEPSGYEVYDTYFDIQLLYAIGVYYKNIADDTYEDFFKKFRKKILNKENLSFVLYDYHDSLYYPSIIHLLQDKSLFTVFSSSSNIEVSDEMSIALNEIDIKIKDWIGNHKSGVQYTELYLLAKAQLEKDKTYEAYIAYTELLYSLSKSAYIKSLIRLSDLVSKYSTSPLLYSEYSKVVRDSSSLQLPMSKYELHTAIVKKKQYESVESIDITNIVDFYTTLSFSTKSADNLGTLILQDSDIIKILQENKNKHAAELGIAIYRAMAQSGYTIPSKDLDALLYDSIHSYGTYDQQAKFFYFQSNYFIKSKKIKLAYTYLRESKITNNIKNIIDNGMSQVSMDYLTQFCTNYLELAKESRRIFFVSEVLNTGKELFNVDNYDSLEDKEELQLLYNNFLKMSKQFKLNDVYEQLKAKKYWLKGIKK